MNANVRVFPIDHDKKLDNILKEFRELLDREFGKDTYAAYVALVNAPNLTSAPEEDVTVTSYRFTAVPAELAEDDRDAFAGLLYKTISKDSMIGKAVIMTYTDKFADIMGNMLESAENEEEG